MIRDVAAPNTHDGDSGIVYDLADGRRVLDSRDIPQRPHLLGVSMVDDRSLCHCSISQISISRV